MPESLVNNWVDSWVWRWWLASQGQQLLNYWETFLVPLSQLQPQSPALDESVPASQWTEIILTQCSPSHRRGASWPAVKHEFNKLGFNDFGFNNLIFTTLTFNTLAFNNLWIQQPLDSTTKSSTSLTFNAPWIQQSWIQQPLDSTILNSTILGFNKLGFNDHEFNNPLTQQS